MILVTSLFVVFVVFFIDMVFGHPILLRLDSLITKDRLVYLQDMDGEVALSIARVNGFGELTAQRYPYSNIRVAVLGEDGVVLNSSYVKKWKYK